MTISQGCNKVEDIAKVFMTISQGYNKVEDIANPWYFQPCSNLVWNKVVTTKYFCMGLQKFSFAMAICTDQYTSVDMLNFILLNQFMIQNGFDLG